MNSSPTPFRICEVEACHQKHLALGMCRKHYRTSPIGREFIRAQKRRYQQTPGGKAVKAQLNVRRKVDPVSNLKKRAKDAAWLGLQKGALERKPCEECGQKAQAHHDSYFPEDWLKVRWLCPLHHRHWHMKNTAVIPPLNAHAH